MMFRHYALLGTITAAVAALVACGGSDASNGSTSQAVTTNFDGTYVPTSAGAIGSIAFSHGRDYLLMPTGCASQGCAEIGTYVIDGAKSSVVLTSASGSSRSLSLKILATSQRRATIAQTQAVASRGLLAVRDLIEKDAEGEDLVGDSDGGSLVALVQALINAITQASMNGQDMSQAGADGGADDGSGSADDGDDTSTPDAGGDLCADPSTTDGGPCTFVDCRKNIPTTASSSTAIDTYFRLCPAGPSTRSTAH